MLDCYGRRGGRTFITIGAVVRMAFVLCAKPRRALLCKIFFIILALVGAAILDADGMNGR